MEITEMTLEDLEQMKIHYILILIIFGAIMY